MYQREQTTKNVGRSGLELYFDTAGEIEARDAANRRALSSEQRKTSPPRLGDEDTVFSDDNEMHQAKKQKKIPSNQQSANVGRSVMQRSSNSAHINMSSAAAAGILGISSISNASDSVKHAVSVLALFHQSVDM